MPSLATPLLAGQATEVLDASTLAILTRAVLEEKKKAEVEEEERMRRQRRQAEEHEEHAGAQQAGPRRLAAHSSRARGLEGVGLSPSVLCWEEEEEGKEEEEEDS